MKKTNSQRSKAKSYVQGWSLAESIRDSFEKEDLKKKYAVYNLFSHFQPSYTKIIFPESL